MFEGFRKDLRRVSGRSSEDPRKIPGKFSEDFREVSRRPSESLGEVPAPPKAPRPVLSELTGGGSREWNTRGSRAMTGVEAEVDDDWPPSGKSAYHKNGARRREGPRKVFGRRSRIPEDLRGVFRRSSAEFSEGLRRLLGRFPGRFWKIPERSSKGCQKVLERSPEGLRKVPDKRPQGFRKICGRFSDSFREVFEKS